MGNDNKRGRKAKETDYNNIFAVRLRKLIDKTGKTQQEIADSIGVSRQALNKWVNGETVPDIFSAVKIADLFDVSTDYLTGRTDVSSVDTDIQTACKVTGLSENVLNHLCTLANDDTVEVDREILENVLCSIHEYILFLIEKYFRIREKKEIFDKAVVYNFCQENNIDVSFEDIEERGKEIFNINSGVFSMNTTVKYLLEFSKYNTKIHYNLDNAPVNFDPELNEDTDYLKYKLSCELNEAMIDRGDYCVFDDEYCKKLFDYYCKILSFENTDTEYINFVLENRNDYL